MTDFQFKEIDHQGQETLEIIGLADKFNRWMYNSIKPYCKENIIELGCGIGNISKFFLLDGHNLTLSDIRDNYCTVAKDRFIEFSNLKGVYNIDISHNNFEENYSEHLGRYNTVFALNILEHIEDDLQAVKNCHQLLAENGKLILLVPALESLYNNFDRELLHYRRYNKEKMKELLLQSGFELEKSFRFNAVGILGWYIFGSLLKKKIIPEGQMKFYNKLVPLIKIADWTFFRSIGLSLITVSRKKKAL